MRSWAFLPLQWAAHQLPSQQLQASRRDDELVGYCRRVCVQPSDMGGRVPWGVAGVFFYQTTLFRLFVFFRRWFKKAVTETLLRTDQNLPGWVFPFCQKVDFHIQCILPTSHFKPGTEIKFPLLFTEELDFDLYPYLLVGDDGLGTVTTSWKNDPMWFFLLQNLRLDVCLWCLE